MKVACQLRNLTSGSPTTDCRGPNHRPLSDFARADCRHELLHIEGSLGLPIDSHMPLVNRRWRRNCSCCRRAWGNAALPGLSPVRLGIPMAR